MMNTTQTSSGSSLNTLQNEQSPDGLGNCRICKKNIDGNAVGRSGKVVAVIATPCNHNFHADCLKDSSNTSTAGVSLSDRDVSCPICQGSQASLPPLLRAGLNEAVENCNSDTFHKEWQHIQDNKITMTADDRRQLTKKAIQHTIKLIEADNNFKNFSELSKILEDISSNDFQLMLEWRSSAAGALIQRMNNEFMKCNYDNFEQFRQYGELIWPDYSDFESYNISHRASWSPDTLRPGAKELPMFNKTLRNNVISLIENGLYEQASGSIARTESHGLSLTDDGRKEVCEMASELLLRDMNEAGSAVMLLRIIKHTKLALTDSYIHQLVKKTIQDTIKSVEDGNLDNFYKWMQLLRDCCDNVSQLMDEYRGSLSDALIKYMDNEFEKGNFGNLDKYRKFARVMKTITSSDIFTKCFRLDGTLASDNKDLGVLSKTLREKVIDLIQQGSYTEALFGLDDAKSLGLSLKDDALQKMGEIVSTQVVGNINVKEYGTAKELLRFIKSTRLELTDAAQNKIKQLVDITIDKIIENEPDSGTELLGIVECFKSTCRNTNKKLKMYSMTSINAPTDTEKNLTPYIETAISKKLDKQVHSLLEREDYLEPARKLVYIIAETKTRLSEKTRLLIGARVGKEVEMRLAQISDRRDGETYDKTFEKIYEFLELLKKSGATLTDDTRRSFAQRLSLPLIVILDNIDTHWHCSGLSQLSFENIHGMIKMHDLKISDNDGQLAQSLTISISKLLNDQGSKVKGLKVKGLKQLLDVCHCTEVSKKLTTDNRNLLQDALYQLMRQVLTAPNFEKDKAVALHDVIKFFGVKLTEKQLCSLSEAVSEKIIPLVSMGFYRRVIIVLDTLEAIEDAGITLTATARQSIIELLSKCTDANRDDCVELIQRIKDMTIVSETGGART